MPTDNSLSAAYQMTCLCFTSLRHCTRALLLVHPCPLNAGKGMRPVRNGAEMRGYLADRRRKKTLNVSSGLLHLFDAWQFPTLAWGDPTLPSALRRFTSEFGMGSGGTTALQPPGKFFVLRPASFTLLLRWLPSRRSVTYLSMLLHPVSVAALHSAQNPSDSRPQNRTKFFIR